MVTTKLLRCCILPLFFAALPAAWLRPDGGVRILFLGTGHLPPEELAKIAARAKPKTLVLSHLSKRFLPVFKHYDLERTVSLCSKEVDKVVVAQDGMELTLR
jgi:ribonuclease BN (tRNA processing enzyme)